MTQQQQQQPMGPAPTLLSRKQVDALYETMEAIIRALGAMDNVDYIVTGGSLLGAIRQHSLLFCDDDADIAIVEANTRKNHIDGQEAYGSAYEQVSSRLQDLLGPEYLYQKRPWEGGDRVRPKSVNTVFVDIFTIRRYDCQEELVHVLGTKKNGTRQSDAYVEGILENIHKSAHSQGETTPLYPLWHFDTRKAVEMWPKEVYRTQELFPLQRMLKFGPLEHIKGPQTPVLLLRRAFGCDCFDVYYQSASHNNSSKSNSTALKTATDPSVYDGKAIKQALVPRVLDGGTWEGGTKTTLTDDLYLPVMPVSRAKRRLTGHCKESLFAHLVEQTFMETNWLEAERIRLQNRTIYMDGVFDLFHIGHLKAIQQCAKMGSKVVLGVTGDQDATSYKRPPIISQEQRAALVGALACVHRVICPCPLVVTEEFMVEHGIDLVVHGFANEADAERQYEFFQLAIETGRFQRISYYIGLSTTDIIRKIRALQEDELP